MSRTQYKENFNLEIQDQAQFLRFFAPISIKSKI